MEGQSMFENLLTRIGIGGVTMDTRLSDASYRREDSISGVIEVTGGDSPQEVRDIKLTLYEVASGNGKGSDCEEEHEVLQTARHAHMMTFGEGKTVDIPFECSASGLAVSDESHSIRLHTKVFLPNSIDANDEDDIRITE